MKLKIMILAAALTLIVVPQAFAGPGQKLARTAAQAACKAERAQLGAAAFRATYGKQARRNCIRAHMREAVQAVRNAAQECRAEREADADAFGDRYGENENGRNAFGKCVSRKVRASVAEEVQETMNAAQECREERRADPDAFRAKYGTNGKPGTNGYQRNAFGKCVASKAGPSADDEQAGGGAGERGLPPVTPP